MSFLFGQPKIPTPPPPPTPPTLAATAGGGAATRAAAAAAAGAGFNNTVQGSAQGSTPAPTAMKSLFGE